MITMNRFFGGSALAGNQMKLLAGPVLIIMILSMMILPLPPFVLDLFFTFNITLSIMVLLVSMFTTKPLEFAAFPAVLLFSTLLRLSLNVASTRVILMHGHEGEDAAGRVVEAFADFLVGGNFAVGMVVFIILVVINFMVITKGSERIAEVGARFVLDAMPGKQMAIDADLNAGLINESEARKRREEIGQEADFFGSMDGASKFVRGDAIAGILIMVINIIGGLVIGVGQHSLDFGTAAHTYTLLTIGDGLVAQIPALVISTAAGVTVSRVRTEQDVGQQLLSQLFTNPKVLYLAGGVMGLLGIVPGMPTMVFLLFTVMLCGMAWWLSHRRPTEERQEEREAVANATKTPENVEASWKDVSIIEPLSLEIGYRLITLVDKHQGNELLNRIRNVRKKFAQEIGFLPPIVHIKDDLNLTPQGYRISLNGVEKGEGEAWPGEWLAIDPGSVVGSVEGRETQDPAFGLPATWVLEKEQNRAQLMGYTVVDASTVIATHLNDLMRRYSADLLGRTETQALLDRVTEAAPELVKDVVPKPITLDILMQILKNLLREEVPIRDMRTILETLTLHSAQTKDPNELTVAVRAALGGAITQHWFGNDKTLNVIGLDGQLEHILSQAMQNGSALEPGLADMLVERAEAAVEAQQDAGDPLVLIVPPLLRPLLSHFLLRRIPQLAILSQAEIPDDRIVHYASTVGSR